MSMSIPSMPHSIYSIPSLKSTTSSHNTTSPSDWPHSNRSSQHNPIWGMQNYRKRCRREWDKGDDAHGMCSQRWMERTWNMCCQKRYDELRLAYVHSVMSSCCVAMSCVTCCSLSLSPPPTVTLRTSLLSTKHAEIARLTRIVTSLQQQHDALVSTLEEKHEQVKERQKMMHESVSGAQQVREKEG